jgi:hypothetical protein
MNAPMRHDASVETRKEEAQGDQDREGKSKQSFDLTAKEAK